ncbi:MAG: alpha-1,4-glucan--maltose-1-phosphate maltosyltransferase [Candidatus Manganitrophus sp.]|nr:alpha-1,4-glucan--maltose-1-phosphate maltosyltransferase [Candidatus Manganitrophus sp.]MDC4227171.1 alpha-1,4-glucan--maltose-1-phosphate maltosyltransferase [Candidatus Manganitrophus sp.]WDT71432.1 MAG: alpha-1,4-glucan--maltose-1-phosphate maltosyltransferase [Candidatus Manganitrophus sp.]
MNLPFPKEAPQRVIIDRVLPEIDGGRYPIKRTAGEKVSVTAHLFADGHDRLAARLLYKPKSEQTWSEVVLQPSGNDVWQGEFIPLLNKPHQYTVEAWIDRFGSWRADLVKRVDAGQDVAGELLEGAALVSEAGRRASGADQKALHEAADVLSSGRPQKERIALALDEKLADRISRYPDRSRATRYDRILEVTVDRDRARYGAWYEMFPRSAGPDPNRSATFLEAESRLPEIAAMGFDVLYLPPIHPIGKSFRKGPNNALAAGPNDPGSPWAIGSEAGGHKAVDPNLGTLADFRHFVEAADRHGLEVALDIAFQCSPDHPYVKEHPEWFRHRPDGTIKYAENPPKKYQDIYPLNFESDDWKGLWTELKSVVEFWIEQGVKIFRVDNPHTKPFHFWEWLIGEIQKKHPETIFLAEAFTRPKVMYGLAKGGFTQSYTYFTWRNTKQELTEYLTELTQTEARDFFRPNFFANTPDILHEYLQTGGRPAFQVRLVLAATLAANYGIYSGFELCENRAVRGTEEYLDSEKYQVRAWDWDRPGNIKDLVARVNQIRRENPALHSNDRLRFYTTDNDQLICYAKTTEDLSNIILVAVNLDPHHLQHGWVEVPIDELGIAPGEPYQLHDLISGDRYLWHDAWNYIRLDPMLSPVHIFRVRRKIHSERDFDPLQ